MFEGLKTAKNSVFAVYALGYFWYILIYLSKVVPFFLKIAIWNMYEITQYQI